MQYTIRSGDTLSRIAAIHGTTFQALLDANPRLGMIRVGDVILIPDYVAPGLADVAPQPFAMPAGWILGSLSSKYETGGRGPGTVSSGIGDAGGVSYGSYQMTSRPRGGTVARFVAGVAFPWRNRFAALKPGSPEFSTAWRALASEAPEAFFEVQHAFIKGTHFDPLIAKVLAEDDLNLRTRSPAVQDAVWSTAVQHGPHTPVVHRAIVALGGTQNLHPVDLARDRRLIGAIYAERGRRGDAGNLVYFARNSRAVQNGVARRFRDEERDALRMLDRITEGWPTAGRAEPARRSYLAPKPDRRWRGGDAKFGVQVVRRTPHMDVQATIPMKPGTRFEVEIFTDVEHLRPGESGDDVLITAPSELVDFYLDVWLVTSNHFEVVESPLDKLHIQTHVADSNRVTFLLRTRSIDELRVLKNELPALNKGSITAVFVYESRPCGRVSRVIELEVDAAELDKETPSRLAEGDANRAMVPKPRTGVVFEPAKENADMCVLIIEEEETDGRHFHCRVTTSLGDTAGPWTLNEATSKVVSGYIANFTKKGKSKKQLIAALKGAGKELFEAAPKNFREAFWKLIDTGRPPHTIQIVTEEAHFLWELMVPTRDQEIRAPLGVEFVVGRWVTGNARSPIRQIPITDSYVIAPVYKGSHKLKHAEAEAELICRMYNGEKIDPASYDNIVAQLGARQVSLLHFACHGRGSDEKQILELVDDGELTIEELKGDEVFSVYFSAKHPLVFLNACEVGRQQRALTGAGGMVAALIALGAAAVIAPVWSVKDTVAHQIARDFYNKLNLDRELPLATIFREIRKRAYQEGEDTYAAYCFYGDPRARLWTEPQPTEPYSAQS